MFNRARIFLFAALTAVFLSSCGQEQSDPVPVTAPKPDAKKAAPVVKADEVKVEPETVKKQDEKQRNPFQSHLIVAKAQEGQKKRIKGPLECCELNLFRVSAVVLSGERDGAYAVVHSPENKRYVVRRGDVIGTMDGRIISFSDKGFVVRELTKDADGKVVLTNDVEIRLQPGGADHGIRK